jgi:hypothetical protein
LLELLPHPINVHLGYFSGGQLAVEGLGTYDGHVFFPFTHFGQVQPFSLVQLQPIFLKRFMA